MAGFSTAVDTPAGGSGGVAEARSLRPVPEEASLVRQIFERYLALGSVQRLKAELDERKDVTNGVTIVP